MFDNAKVGISPALSKYLNHFIIIGHNNHIQIIIRRNRKWTVPTMTKHDGHCLKYDRLV